MRVGEEEEAERRETLFKYIVFENPLGLEGHLQVSVTC